ncbi:sulfite exporter TauE/SafE family protein [Actibacterium sp. 188UL27-1]|uniref:sulfite exporter TauE/SafE family protein n=1 Tax=Actibacterium sp. 188UL27-1 TaxID=2786961 RepID=UPI00351C2725
MDPVTFSVFVAVTFVLAGAVKGLTGLGLPMAAIGVMTFFLDPRTAIALVLFPMLMTNVWQVWRMGQVWAALKRYKLFAGALVVCVWVTTVLTVNVSDGVIQGSLGVVLVVFAGVSMRFQIPRLPDRWDATAQLIMGGASGVLGGLTSIWAPTMATYLHARHVEKDEFVRATGLLILLGSLPLIAGYTRAGFLTGPLAGYSLVLLVPSLIGFTLGEWLRARISPERFRLILLYVFVIVGLNLIRRALF